MGGLVSVGYFLFSLAFKLLIFLLWARFLLRYFRVSSLHPISQAIHTVTHPILFPVEKIVKLNASYRSQYDWPCLIAIVLVEFIKFLLVSLLMFGKFMPTAYLFLYVIADLITEPMNLMFYAIVIRVIVSWINPGVRNPAYEVIYLITEPIMSQARRILPPFGGLDFSPFLLLVIITAINIFVDGMLPVKLM